MSRLCQEVALAIDGTTPLFFFVCFNVVSWVSGEENSPSKNLFQNSKDQCMLKVNQALLFYTKTALGLSRPGTGLRTKVYIPGVRKLRLKPGCFCKIGLAWAN